MLNHKFLLMLTFLIILFLAIGADCLWLVFQSTGLQLIQTEATSSPTLNEEKDFEMNSGK